MIFSFGRVAGFVLAFVFVGVLSLGMASAASTDRIRQIRVDGAERVEPTTVLSYMNIRVGDAFDQAMMDESVKSLFATGLFTDVSVYQDNLTLVVSVAENPVINEIAFEGNKKLKDEDLTAEIQLRPRTVFTRTKVQADVDRLLDIYRLKGLFSARVDPKIIKLDQNRVNLVFEISEGPDTRIRKVEFVGNKRFDDDKLSGVLRSKEARWYRFLSDDDKYDPARMAFDKELLRRFYLNHGYADFRVDSAVAELTPDRKDFFLTFVINEGVRYSVSAVDVISRIPELDATGLKKKVTIEAGDWYNAGAVDDNVVTLTNAVGNMQVNFVEVQPQVERLADAGKLKIVFNLSEGPKNFIERINISGNSRTLDEVIRREMQVAEGDPLNNVKLRKSEQKIRDLDYFEKIEMKPREGSAPDKTVVDVAVEEKSTGELSIGGGFSTADGPLADFRLREKNLLGKGQMLEFATTLSGVRSEFDISFTEPYFMRKDLSAGFDVYHKTRDLQSESSYDQKRTGGALRLGYPLANNWRQSLSYGIERNEIRNVSSEASRFIREQAGDSVTSSITQRLTYDITDSKIDPTEGFVVRLDNQLAGLGGDDRFFKTKLGGTYYYPVHDQWTLSLLGEGGYVFGFSDRDVGIDDRFFLGGSSFRGFQQAGIGPRDISTRDALGGNRYFRGSAELAFPVGLPEEMGIRAHVFSDFGMLDTLDIKGNEIRDDSTIRVSAGGGVSWRSPLGPIRIDLASPLQDEQYDQTEVFSFSFGTRF